MSSRRFRAGQIGFAEASAGLTLGRTRFFKFYTSYLAAAALRRAHLWSPAASGANHRTPIAAAATATLRKLLGSVPPCSDSFAASEILRRHDAAMDRATVRRCAVVHWLKILRRSACAKRPAADPPLAGLPPRPVASALRHRPAGKRSALWLFPSARFWQYDASPHRWFADQDRQPSLIEIIDDHRGGGVEIVGGRRSGEPAACSPALRAPSVLSQECLV